MITDLNENWHKDCARPKFYVKKYINVIGSLSLQKNTFKVEVP